MEPSRQQDPTATPRTWSHGTFAPKPLLAQKRPSPRSGKGPDSPIRTPRAPLTRPLPSQPFRQLLARLREKLRVAQQIQGLARRTARTLRSDAAAVLGDSANERSRARGSLKCGNEPRILVYDAEQLIESRRMRDRRL